MILQKRLLDKSKFKNRVEKFYKRTGEKCGDEMIQVAKLRKLVIQGSFSGHGRDAFIYVFG